jgi:hypothetical protein
MTETGAPYRTPQGAPPIVDALAPLPPFAEGELLVISTGTELPRVCVKCGKKGDLLFREQAFAFADQPSIGARIMFGAFAHAVAAAKARKGNLTLPICEVCEERWKDSRVHAGLALAVLLLPLAVALFGMSIDDKSLAASGLFVMFLAMFPVGYVNRVVVPKRTIQCKGIAGRYMKLAGFGEAARKAILGGMDEKPKKRKKKPAA